jgi:cell wall-associated NlpC family hydrolase
MTTAIAACATGQYGAGPAAFPRAPEPIRATPSAWSTSAGVPNPAGDALVGTALGLLGVDYRLGGEEPATGLDCSGMVRFVFERHHLTVPRTVAEQQRVGDRVDWNGLQAGDLIFFTTIGPGATHVGIVLGPDRPGEFVHAPGTGSVVRVDRYDAAYWRDRVVGIRRVLPPPGGSSGSGGGGGGV